MVDTNTQALTPAQQFHSSFTKMESQFSLALPKHMPVERFMRVVLTAVNSNPDLLNADRQSLFESAMKAAQDGLLPDGREGALVVYNTKIPGKNGEKDRWIKKVQWMPMVAGIMKKARNSGEIALITAGCVWGGDKFRYWIDDDGEHIFYEPGEKQDRNIFVKAFAMAKLKDGTVYALPMSPSDVDKVRAASKAKDGPAWNNWYDQMAQKAAIRRLAKRLPMSSDLDDLIRRDDELYDFGGKDDPERVPFQPVKNPLADEEPKAIKHDAGETGGGAPAEAGSEEELEEYDLVIELDGKVTIKRGKIEGGCSILDRRFEGSDAYFQHADQWHEACDDNKFLHHFDADGNLTRPPAAAKGTQERGGAAREAASAAGDEAGQSAPAASKPDQAASQGPGNGGSAATAANQPTGKAYKDGAGFLDWLKGELDACKTKAAVQELWGACRQDRADLCSADQIEAAADLKNAAIERVNKAKR